MAFLTQQNTKNATHGRVFHVCVLPPPAQPAEFVPPAATRHLRAPSPPPSSRTPERDHKVAFWCLSAQPSTFYHPGTKNATTGSCSSCLGGFPYPRHPFHYPLQPRHEKRDLCRFPYPRHEHATPASRSLCLGCPTTLPTPHYHPDPKNATLWSRFSCLGRFPYPRHEHVTAASRSLCLGCPTTLPTPTTTQTQRTRPCGRVFRVWVVSHTPDMNTRPQRRVLHVWGVPPPFPLPTTT